MDKQLKQAWLDALRSGDYTQGQAFLCRRQNDGTLCHCCLGVLLEIMQVPKHLPDHEDAAACEYELNGVEYELNGVRVEAIPNVADSFEPHAISLIDGLSSEQLITLVILNDRQGASFDEIADYIEENI